MKIFYKGAFVALCLFFQSFNSVAALDEQDQIIHITRRTFNSESQGINNLVLPSSTEDVDSLAINHQQKLLSLIREGKEPLVLDKSSYPSLPWELSQDRFEKFLESHTFFLRSLEDGTYKVDIQAPCLGGMLKSGPFFDKKPSQPTPIQNATFMKVDPKVLPNPFATPKPTQITPAPFNPIMGVPKPAFQFPKPQGVNNPITKQALNIGNQKHNEFKVLTKPLSVSDNFKLDGKLFKPDLIASKMVVELKPATISGLQKD